VNSIYGELLISVLKIVGGVMPESKKTEASKITEEGIDKLRRMIGVRFPLQDQFNTVVSEDAVRHYALGLGDDNPRWTDQEYAKTTKWGGVLAHSSFVLTCGSPHSQGLPGVHALFAGIDMQCHAPVKAGARINASAFLSELVEKQEKYAGRQFQQIYRTEYKDEDDQLLTTVYSYSFRTERQAASSKGKYAKIERKTWTDDELNLVEADIEQEREMRRGATPRFIESVSVGDSVGPVVKGPLTATDCICFLIGFGYIFVRAHRQWHEFRSLHPKAGIKNSYGVWDIPERVHWEEEMPEKLVCRRPMITEINVSLGLITVFTIGWEMMGGSVV
jgi:acyl dehydratase